MKITGRTKTSMPNILVDFEKNDDDDEILLVGEANFSFTLSLCSQYATGRQKITTSCFESRSRLEEMFGREAIESNLASLARMSSIKQIRFEVDATRLAEMFPKERFTRIYFMFPHVSGRSNLRKNRALMMEFFRSCREVLKSQSSSSSSVLVTLAGGQGGTSFERDVSKRGCKDSWTINQLAQQNGFVLTACDEFQPAAFECYTSSGFRSQSKSFSVRDALVHKFQPSLPIDIYKCSVIDHFNRFSRVLNSVDVIKHPFVQLRDFLAAYLSSDSFIVQ